MDLYFPYYSFYSSYERVASMGLALLAEISGLYDQINHLHHGRAKRAPFGMVCRYADCNNYKMIY
jgi:hypothetical protein